MTTTTLHHFWQRLDFLRSLPLREDRLPDGA